MELSTEHAEHIARLARIGMTPDELEGFRSQLSDILDRFNVLSEVDTDGVETTAHPSDVAASLRADLGAESQTREQTLANAPNRHGDFVRVRAVLQ